MATNDNGSRTNTGYVSRDTLEINGVTIELSVSRTTTKQCALELHTASDGTETVNLAELVPSFEIPDAWGWEGKEVGLGLLAEKLLPVQEKSPPLLELLLQALVAHLPQILKDLDREGTRRHEEAQALAEDGTLLGTVKRLADHHGILPFTNIPASLTRQ